MLLDNKLTSFLFLWQSTAKSKIDWARWPVQIGHGCAYLVRNLAGFCSDCSQLSSPNLTWLCWPSWELDQVQWRSTGPFSFFFSLLICNYLKLFNKIPKLLLMTTKLSSLIVFFHFRPFLFCGGIEASLHSSCNICMKLALYKELHYITS